MQTYPYATPNGIIDLIRKDEHDAIVRELNERLRILHKQTKTLQHQLS